MYCPRCGSQNTDVTKFCRQCGLPLAQVMDYVATGGTGALARPAAAPPPPPHLVETAEMLALKQKRTMTILSICIAPIIFAIIANNALGLGDISGIPFLLIPLGIVWAKSRYRMELRQLQERQLQEYYERHQQQQSMPQQAPAPRLIIQAPSNQSQPGQSQPAQSQFGQAQMDAPRTNPLAEQAPGSVVEDETRKFSER